MLKIIYSNQFLKDSSLMKKRNLNMTKLAEVITLLVSRKTLPEQYKDHPLQGQYASKRECHIQPDWLLVYSIVGDELRLARTGSHADLFK
jgi:mRNA interferase YafQ